MEVITLYVYQGKDFARVLARSESSPTGFFSVTGAFPTTQDAIDAVVSSKWLGNAPLRFLDLETRETIGG